MTNRLDTLTSWHADWTGLRVGVLGLGVTGFSVADTLAELGADAHILNRFGFRHRQICRLRSADDHQAGGGAKQRCFHRHR